MTEILLTELVPVGQGYYLTCSKLPRQDSSNQRACAHHMSKSLPYKLMVQWLLREGEHHLCRTRGEKENWNRELEEEAHVIWASPTAERCDHHGHALVYSAGPSLGRGEIGATVAAVFLPTETWNRVSYGDTWEPLHLYQTVCILSWGTKLGSED